MLGLYDWMWHNQWMSIRSANFRDFLTPSVSFSRWDFNKSPDPDLCAHALSSRLYSTGTDFTAWYIKGGGRPGLSYMKRFWERSIVDDAKETHEGGSIWLLEAGGKCVGAVILEHCIAPPITIGDRELHGRWANSPPRKTFEAMSVGRVAMWLDPQHRNRGLMKLLAQLDLVPTLEKRARKLQGGGLLPFVRASDASARILEQCTTLPVPGFFRTCLNEKERLRGIMEHMGLDMHRHDTWAVPWQPTTRSTAKPRRMKA